MGWQNGTREVQACTGLCIRGKKSPQTCSAFEARCGHRGEGSPCSQHGQAEGAQHTHEHPLPTLLPGRARPPSPQIIILCHHPRERPLRKESPRPRSKGRLTKQQPTHNRVCYSLMQAHKVPHSSPGSQKLCHVSSKNTSALHPLLLGFNSLTQGSSSLPLRFMPQFKCCSY